MHIDANDTIAGQPILAIRNVLRYARTGQLNHDMIKSILRTDSETAHYVISELVHQGYLERNTDVPQYEQWRTTVHGNALAQASARKQITRGTADRLVADVIERAVHVRDNPAFVYKIGQLWVFGSYLSDTKQLSDLDLAIELVPKVADQAAFARMLTDRSEQAQDRGQHFATVLDYLYWPQTEVALARHEIVSCNYFFPSEKATLIGPPS